jgi:large subunit ribosomal protein L19e
MAAKILKIGKNRVWIDPESADDVAKSITREDIRERISDGSIKKKEKKGVSRARVRTSKRREGSRKGKRGAKSPKKERWIRKIRALRRRLRTLKEDGVLDSKTYRELYNKASGGEFKSVSHLNAYLGLKRKNE